MLFSCLAHCGVASPIGGIASIGNQEDGMSASAMNPEDSKYELRFRSLFKPGSGLSFACDSNGRVDLDALSERARCNYLYARTVIGKEFFIPEVLPCPLH